MTYRLMLWKHIGKTCKESIAVIKLTSDNGMYKLLNVFYFQDTLTIQVTF